MWVRQVSGDQGTLEKHPLLLGGDRLHCPVPPCSHIPVPSHSCQPVSA